MLLTPFILFCSALAVPVVQDQDIANLGEVADQTAHHLARSVQSTASPQWTELVIRGAAATPKGSSSSLAPSSSTVSSSQSKHSSASSSSGQKKAVVVFSTDKKKQNLFIKAAADAKLPIEGVKLLKKDTTFVFWTATMTDDEIKKYNTTKLAVKISLDYVYTVSGESKKSTKPTKSSKSGVKARQINNETLLSATLNRRLIPNEQIKDGDPNPFQKNVPYELAMISQYKQSKTPSTDYRYNAARGRGVDLYYTDTGLNAQHPLVTNWKKGDPSKHIAEPQLGWPVAEGQEKVEADHDPKGHGSCVWSKLVGELGVSKYANVFVTIPDGEFMDLEEDKKMVRTWVTAGSDLYDSLVTILREIEKRKENANPNPAIVSISQDLDAIIEEDQETVDEYVEAYRALFKAFSKLKISVFYSAPNRLPNVNGFQHIDPAKNPIRSLVHEEAIDNLFIVSGVDKNGAYSKLVQQDNEIMNKKLVTFYAPAELVTCIPGQGNGAATTEGKTGNSFANPIAASLGGYFLSLEGHKDWDPPRLKQEINKFAWQRVEDGPPVVANEFSLIAVS